MDLMEAANIVDLLGRFYPAFYVRRTEEERLQDAGLWEAAFADVPADLVLAAVKLFISTDEKGFPPVVGQVMAKLRLIHSLGELSEIDAWNMTLKAVRSVGDSPVPEFEKLPASVRKVVGDAQQLKVWGNMDEATLHSVVASNFRRAYSQRMEREQAFKALPRESQAAVAKFISEQKRALGDGGTRNE